MHKLSDDLVVLPDSAEYDDILKSYFTELQREVRPACFLTPSSASQVADIVKVIKPFAAASTVAICGLGRRATPGVANVQDGIVIHLGKMKGVHVDRENKSVQVAAGENMGNVYGVLERDGLAVVGNRHSTGGIGGDALQGTLIAPGPRRY